MIIVCAAACCLLLILLGWVTAVVADSSEPYSRPIDEHMHYGTIHPFHNEWQQVINSTEHAAAPMHFWFRCIGREVRGYLFIEHLIKLDHDKEAYMPIQGMIGKQLLFFADGQPIALRTWLGGVDFSFSIPADAAEDHWVTVSAQGFKHFTRFPVSKCTPPKPAFAGNDPSTMRYLMHVHLNDHLNTSDINPLVVQGVANHLYYHLCSLSLDQYEVVIHANQLQHFLANAHIAAAVEQGLVSFILRNPTVPEPMQMFPNQRINCYWQPYTENLALLRHWKENVRIFFMDSDEFLTFNNTLSKQQFFHHIQTHPSVGFVRYMAFRQMNADHHKGSADVADFSFNQRAYLLMTDRLAHTKLVVDPNQVGCYIVHWAGCGAAREDVNKTIGFIAHFENLYRNRWSRQQIMRMDHAPLVPSANNRKCDPAGLQPGSKVRYFDEL